MSRRRRYRGGLRGAMCVRASRSSRAGMGALVGGLIGGVAGFALKKVAPNYHIPGPDSWHGMAGNVIGFGALGAAAGAGIHARKPQC